MRSRGIDYTWKWLELIHDLNTHPEKQARDVSTKKIFNRKSYFDVWSEKKVYRPWNREKKINKTRPSGELQ